MTAGAGTANPAETRTSPNHQPSDAHTGQPTMPYHHITTIPLRNRPPARVGDIIDDICAAGAGISLRQTDKHTIRLDISTGSERQSFRFESATPGKGPGIRLCDSGQPPPGRMVRGPGYETEIADYQLPQGNIQLERMNQNRYWIRVSASMGDGTLYAETRGGRKARITLIRTSAHAGPADH